MPDSTHETTRREIQSPEELLEKAHRAVELAVAAGADEAGASISRRVGMEFRWRDGRLENTKEDATQGLGVALYVDGRYSTHSTNDLHEGRLKDFLTEAVALTRQLEADPYRQLPDTKLYEDRPNDDLDLIDERLLDTRREQRIAWCREIEDEAKTHESVVSTTTHVHDGHAISARATSNGFSGTHEATTVVYGSVVTIREGETKRPEDHHFAFGTHIEDLPVPSSIGAEALHRVLSRRGSRMVDSRRATLVLHPEAGASLIGRLLGALTANAVQQKRTFLAEKLGERIASEQLTLVDDPLRPRGLASHTFDPEGISAKARPIIEEGVLKSFFVDTYYGRKLGWEPTSGTPTNSVFRHGDKDLEGLVREVGEGVLVTSWIGGNANLTSGDFSFGVRGHLLRDGQIADPISEMNVTGNYLDLMQKLVLVGNDPVPWFPCRTPTMVFEDVQFSGS